MSIYRQWEARLDAVCHCGKYGGWFDTDSAGRWWHRFFSYGPDTHRVKR